MFSYLSLTNFQIARSQRHKKIGHARAENDVGAKIVSNLHGVGGPPKLRFSRKESIPRLASIHCHLVLSLLISQRVVIAGNLRRSAQELDDGFQ